MRTIKRNLHRQQEEVDTEGTWAISYGDMITLLLSFFVLYFTVDPKAEQQERLQKSLITNLEAMAQPSEEESSKGVRLHIGEEQASDVDEKVLAKLGAKVHQVGQRVIVEFPGISFFEVGKIAVREDAVKTLTAFAKLYTPFAGQYLLGIRAFTDNRPVIPYKSRKFSDNLELSALRSVATMRVLQTRGIPLHRMKLSGLGEFEITPEELKAAGIDWSNRDPRDLARKVVLVIEPATKTVGKAKGKVDGGKG
ncbi:MAG: hypothetical protein H6624_03515 [Bdellovibrionaceae bacterium]|nr:hypothetical protein [Bdellovibrionales bacterium]MCB9083383.1 hypothetical protein [Pseudobdellovibrionaceae bacterium]